MAQVAQPQAQQATEVQPVARNATEAQMMQIAQAKLAALASDIERMSPMDVAKHIMMMEDKNAITSMQMQAELQQLAQHSMMQRQQLDANTGTWPSCTAPSLDVVGHLADSNVIAELEALRNQVAWLMAQNARVRAMVPPTRSTFSHSLTHSLFVITSADTNAC